MIIALLSNCSTCIKWDNIFSEVFEISFGVRQGSVLSLILFALYIDDIGKSCFVNCGHDIILYVDDYNPYSNLPHLLLNLKNATYV